MDSSFKGTLARVDRSIERNQRSLRDVRAQRKAIAGQLSVAAYAALDRRLGAHEERITRQIDALQFERQALVELIAASPELPMDPPPKKR